MDKDLRINTDHILKSDHKFHLAMIHQMMCFGVGKTIDSRVTLYYMCIYGKTGILVIIETAISNEEVIQSPIVFPTSLSTCMHVNQPHPPNG